MLHRLIVAAAALLLAAGSAQAAVTLEGAVVNLGFSDGSVASGDFDTTNSVNGAYYLFLATGDLTRYPDYLTQSPTTNLNYTLSPGDNNFAGYFHMGTASNNYGVLNLYFGSSATPSISVYAEPTSDLNAPPAYAATSQSGMMSLLQPSGHNTSVVDGSGMLSFTTGGFEVQLTKFLVASNAAMTGNTPCAGTSSISTATCPNSSYQQLGVQFTLAVSPTNVPEPASLALLTVGLAGLAAAQRFGKQPV